MLTPLHIIFYVFASVAIGSALNVILSTNPVRSVLSLVVTFFAMAGIWMILHAEFLSIILVLVYVGAVMTLFLFVVMMLNIDKESSQSGFVSYLPFGIIVALLIMGLMLVVVGPQYFGLLQMPAPLVDVDTNNLKQLGDVLYTEYAYPFEVAGVLLLAAIIAAITLTYRGPLKRKIQNPAKQVDVRPEDRVRLVDLAPELRKKGGTS
jgi:NADH-quinone oxidoreductase subunit J